MVIDDLADRAHDCDLLLDQGLGRVPADYDALVPTTTRRLLGPDFALLRPEFAQLRPASLARRTQGTLERILVSMGGVDMANASTTALRAIASCEALRACHVDVILGPNAPWLNQVIGLAAAVPFSCQVHQDPPSVARLMAASDLCIGAAGTSSWERCCLGLPSIVVSVAGNQHAIAAQLVAHGAAIAALELDDLQAQLTRALEAIPTASGLAQASRAASLICKGDGAERVAAVLTGNSVEH
jgi:UDP-2,4-diacetamido-2,4,6-trideoxy-beta-L-altropyranose hydrolase